MTQAPLASRPHDHSHCVSHALAEAESICTRQGLRLTALRKRVLELVWASHKPLGAYDILGVLSDEDGRPPPPPPFSPPLFFFLKTGRGPGFPRRKPRAR